MRESLIVMKHLLFVRVNDVVDHCGNNIIIFNPLNLRSIRSHNESLNQRVRASVKALGKVLSQSSREGDLYGEAQVCRVGIIEAIAFNIKPDCLTRGGIGGATMWSELY